MHTIATKFMSCLLGDRLKVNCVSACQDSQGGQERQPALLFTTMINDETWIYKHNTETKHHHLHTNVNCMLIMCFLPLAFMELCITHSLHQDKL